MIANTIKTDAMMMATHLLRDWEFDDEDMLLARMANKAHKGRKRSCAVVRS